MRQRRVPGWIASLVSGAALVLLLASALVLRWRVVNEFHAPAGDGIGYHDLGHELRRAARYAYGPTSAPTYARLPGWPLVIAALDTGVPGDLERVLVRGTHLNVLLDLVTALLVLLIAREARLGGAPSWIALALALFSPLSILNACYLLRETFSTTIATAALYLAARGTFRRDERALVAAAAVIGLGMLVRIDLLALGLACLPAWLALDGWRRRLRVAARAVAACAIAFSPWPIRNLVVFGHAYPAREVWIDTNGRPLPMGERFWVSSWVDGLDQDWLNLCLVHHTVVTERDLDPRAWDSPEEKREVLALFARYDREGLSPAVDRAFRALALRRFHARPLHRLVYLPLRRAALWWWHFPSALDQPLRSATLRQPDKRWIFERVSNALTVLGLLGWLALLRRRSTRAFAVGVALAIGARTVAMCIIAPDGGGQRYLAPTYPVYLLGVAFLVGGAAAGWRQENAPGGDAANDRVRV